MNAAQDPLQSWPRRTPLRDGEGVVLVYSPGDADYSGRRWADGTWRPESVAAERAAAAVLARLPGWALSTGDPALVTTLSRRGATTLRHAHGMSLDLQGDPPLAQVPDGVSLTALTAERLRERAAEVGRVARAAHGNDGEGWPSDDEAALAMARAAAGQALGPLLDASALALRDDTVVGACLVVDRAGEPPHGGPWVLDVVRDPEDAARGVGAAMLAHSARSLRAVGLGALSLAVSHDNPARAVYERLNFHDVHESWTLTVP